MANANTPLLGYPQPVGAKYQLIFDHVGPASYSNIGTSSGTGDLLNASDLGYGGFDALRPVFTAFYTNSGNYIVLVYTSSSGTTPTLAPPSGSAAPKLVLRWMTTAAAFGAISSEVTNGTVLSGETIRFDATMV